MSFWSAFVPLNRSGMVVAAVGKVPCLSHWRALGTSTTAGIVLLGAGMRLPMVGVTTNADGLAREKRKRGSG